MPENKKSKDLEIISEYNLSTILTSKYLNSYQQKWMNCVLHFLALVLENSEYQLRNRDLDQIKGSDFNRIHFWQLNIFYGCFCVPKYYVCTCCYKWIIFFLIFEFSIYKKGKLFKLSQQKKIFNLRIPGFVKSLGLILSSFLSNDIKYLLQRYIEQTKGANDPLHIYFKRQTSFKQWKDRKLMFSSSNFHSK